MELTKEVIEKIQYLCRQNLREEICGIITDDLEIIPIRNISSNKQSCFIFDKREYIEALKYLKENNKHIYCIYHSHPTNNPEPSKADCNFILSSKTSALIVTPVSYKFVEYRDA